MSDRGTIVEWDAARGWGVLRTDGGVEMAFSQNACEQLTCELGATVFVYDHLPYLGKQRRATAIGATPKPGEASFQHTRIQSELDAELLAKRKAVGADFDWSPYEKVPHVDQVLAQLGIAIDTTILAGADEPFGIRYEPESLLAWVPFDPCFVAFGGVDGDAWGLFCHPDLLARGAAPVVQWHHEALPIEFEAATFADWVQRRGITDRALAAEVTAIVENPSAELAAYTESDETNRLERLDALIASYRATNWPAFLIERALVQRTIVVAEAEHEAKLAQIDAEHDAKYGGA